MISPTKAALESAAFFHWRCIFDSPRASASSRLHLQLRFRHARAHRLDCIWSRLQGIHAAIRSVHRLCLAGATAAAYDASIDDATRRVRALEASSPAP
jgi:hypothetical protein